MFVPFRVLALFLCIHAYTHKHTYFISYRLLYMNRCCANSQMVVPLQVLTLGTSSYSHICSQVDIYHTTDTLVYDSVLCELTCLCPCECSHLEPLCIHACTYKNTQITSQIDLCMSPCYANSQMSVPLRVLTLRTSLILFVYIHVLTSIHI